MRHRMEWALVFVEDTENLSPTAVEFEIGAMEGAHLLLNAWRGTRVLSKLYWMSKQQDDSDEAR